MNFEKIFSQRVPTTMGIVAAALAFSLAWGVVRGEDRTGTSDWPNWRGSNHNGISTETDWSFKWPRGGPKRLWRASIGVGFSSIVVNKGRAYTMGNIKENDFVYCFDAETGKEIWKRSYPCPREPANYEGGPNATPTVHGNAVYTFSRKGHVFCLSADSGNVIWRRDLPKELGLKTPQWGFAGSPLVMGKLLVLNAGTAGVALNKTTGTVVWASGKRPGGYATPVPFDLKGRKCLAIFGEKSIIGVDASDGKRLWKHPWRTQYDVNAADPIISGNKIFVSSGYGKGCALLRLSKNTGVLQRDEFKASVVWQNKNMRNHFASSVLWKGHLYGFDEDQIKCLEFKTGQVKWKKRGFGKGTLMVAGDKFIILSDQGKLVVAELSPNGFKQLAKAQILGGRCWTVPVLVRGRLYARNAKGDLVCLDLRERRRAGKISG